MKIKELYEKVNDGKIISDIELQREIIYDVYKQKLVIDSIVKEIPLPAFYFWKNENGILEVLDGKQRIEAIRKFYQNDIEYEGKLWKECSSEFQEIVNETNISDIVCSGTEDLKREIFFRINTLREPLSRFEVINGLYNGEYLRGITAFVKQDRNVIKILGNNKRGNNQLKVLKMITRLQNHKNIEEYVKANKDRSFENDQRIVIKPIKFIAAVFEKYTEFDILFYLAVKYAADVSIWKENKSNINREISHYLKDKIRLALTDKKLKSKTLYKPLYMAFRLIPNVYFLPKKNNNFYSNKPQKTTNIAVPVVSNYFLKPNSK